VDDHRGDCITKLKKKEKRIMGLHFPYLKRGFFVKEKYFKNEKIIEFIMALLIAKFQIK
jgi:hypothetical protein